MALPDENEHLPEAGDKVHFWTSAKTLFGTKNFRWLAGILVAVALVFTAGIYGVTDSIPYTILGFAFAVFGLPLVGALLLVPFSLLVWMAIAVHEGGHLVAGAIGRYQFQAVSVGPLLIRKAPQSIVTRVSRPIFRLNGRAGMLPTQWQAWPLRLFILGGPIASFLLSVGILFLCKWDNDLIARSFQGQVSSPLDVFLLILLLISLNCFFSAAIPFRYKGVDNDALHFLKILKRKNAEAKAIPGYITYLCAEAVKPRNWDPVMVDKMRDLREAAGIPPLLYYYQLDTGSLDQAAETLRLEYGGYAAKGPLWHPYRQVVSYEYAYIEGRLGRIDLAREALAAGDTTKGGYLYIRNRALSAILAAEGKYDEALDAAEAFRQEMAANPELDPPQVELEWVQQALDAHPPMKTNEPS